VWGGGGGGIGEVRRGGVRRWEEEDGRGRERREGRKGREGSEGEGLMIKRFRGYGGMKERKNKRVDGGERGRGGE